MKKTMLNEFGQHVGFPLPQWQIPPQPPKQTLHGQYCRLEPLDLAKHTRSLFASNKLDKSFKYWTYLPYGPFPTLAKYRAWVEATCLGNDPLFYAIIDFPTGLPAGLVSYLRITPASGSIEIGHVYYSARLRRTRAATETIYLLMKQAFDLGYRRCEWKCDALNAPSRAAAERLGFSYEGTFRQATVYKGRNRDTAWFSVIDSDWPALRDAFQAWLSPDNFDPGGNQKTRLATPTRSRSPRRPPGGK